MNYEYMISCQNALIDEKIITGFENDSEAIELTINYEGVLYKKIDGKWKQIFDSYDCFNNPYDEGYNAHEQYRQSLAETTNFD